MRVNLNYDESCGERSSADTEVRSKKKGIDSKKIMRCSSGIKASFIKSDVSIYCFVCDCIMEQMCAVQSEKIAKEWVTR